MNAEVVGEKLVGDFNRILGDFFFRKRIDLVAGAHGLGDEALSISGFDDSAGQQAEEFVVRIDHRERTEAVAAVGDPIHHLADLLIGGDFDRLLDETMDVVLYPGDLSDLFLIAHVVVDEPEAPVERHLDGHL